MPFIVPFIVPFIARLGMVEGDQPPAARSVQRPSSQTFASGGGTADKPGVSNEMFKHMFLLFIECGTD